jgi:hypothetical protein
MLRFQRAMLKNPAHRLALSLSRSSTACLRTAGWKSRGLSTTGPVRDDRDYKAELTAKQINNDNPFETYVIKPEAGRGLFQGAPILIPSTKDSRYSNWQCFVFVFAERIRIHAFAKSGPV